MDIRYLSQRNYELAAHSSKSGTRGARQTVDAGEVVAAAQVQASTSAAARGAEPAATETSAQQPATLSRFSPAGRLVHVLQSFERRHPEESQQILSNIADKLRSDAEHAGRFSERLTRWADRFQEAADSGDVSKLVPRYEPQSGLRAYQEAQRPEADATVEHVAETAEAQSRESTTTAPPAGTLTATPQNADVSDRPERTTRTPRTTTERYSDTRNRPVTVPESATAERSSDIRSRPVTVPESSTLLVTQ